jgi:hypothetical protein
MGSVMKLKVILDFACVGCAQTVHVTLECSGSGLWGGGETRASVNVPCPTCGSVSAVEFDPSGTVHEVSIAGPRRTLIEPSIN